MPEPRDVYLFANGMVAVTDADGQQIPSLQGRFSEVVSAVIAACVRASTVFHGWPDIRDGGRWGDWKHP